MRNFIKILGSALGCVAGFFVLAFIRDLPLSVVANPGDVPVIIGFFALVGLALGVIIRAVENSKGQLSLLGILLTSVITAGIFSAVITLVVWVMGPTPMDWRDPPYTIMALAILSVCSGLGYFVGSMLSRLGAKTQE